VPDIPHPSIVRFVVPAPQRSTHRSPRGGAPGAAVGVIFVLFEI